jgi:hypothetical protein
MDHLGRRPFLVLASVLLPESSLRKTNYQFSKCILQIAGLYPEDRVLTGSKVGHIGGNKIEIYRALVVRKNRRTLKESFVFGPR